MATVCDELAMLHGGEADDGVGVEDLVPRAATGDGSCCVSTSLQDAGRKLKERERVEAAEGGEEAGNQNLKGIGGQPS